MIMAPDHKEAFSDMQATTPTAPALEARGLSVTLSQGGEDVCVLRDVSFSVAAGELVDITGPSGCGKSTLLRACARMLPRSGGELLLAGTSAAQVPPTQWRARVALAPQKPSLTAASVRENLLLPWTLRQHASEPVPTDEELHALLAELGLADVELDRDASQLSGGQQSRVSLARVLACKPQVLLLDEVDAALDETSARLVGDAVRARVDAGACALRVRHHEDDGNADRVMSMLGGSVCARHACARKGARP